VVDVHAAQQLHAAGEQVGLLVLLEPRPPVEAPRWEFRPLRTRTTLRLIGSRIKLYVQTFAMLRGRQRFDYLLERLKILRQMVAQGDAFRGDRSEYYLRLVTGANMAAVQQYQPPVYPGRVVLFRAEDRKVASGDDLSRAWSRLAAGGLEIPKITGPKAEELRKALPVGCG
jgi:thioesterase domain-containing protein